MKVMIVDDSKNMRQIIINAIKDVDGIEVLEAGNGEEAEATLQEYRAIEEPIEVIILDWMMPHTTGYEFLKKIRNTSLFLESPKVVMLTAETYPEQMNACMKFGVSQYITKPFSKEQIIEVIEKLKSEIGVMKNAV